jgi:hypothetical protein
MSKKPTKRSKPKPKPSQVAASEPTVVETLQELSRLGLIQLVANEDGDDAVAVLIPDELRVPKVVDSETRSAEDRLLIEERTLPARVESLLRVEVLAAWRAFTRFKLGPMLESVTGKTPRQLEKVVREHDIDSMAVSFLEQVIFEGFDFALTRYAEQIKHVPELAEWHRKRADGGEVGRRTSTSRSEEKAQRIRDTWAALEADGKKVTNEIVASACGCSLSTVIRAFKTKPAKPTKR